MKIKFASQRGDEFLTTVRKRVDQYFLKHNLSRNANVNLYIKVVLLFVVLIALYVAIIMEMFPPLILLFMSMALGLVSGFIAINLSHDCLHGAYSENPKVNHVLGYSFDLVGLSSYVWKVSHNGGHHTYTNIAGFDPDIDKPALLRLTPSSPRYFFHRWQHIYIWILYSLVGMNWILHSDYVHMYQYYNKASRSDIFWFYFFKALNLLLLVGIPLYVMTIPWWQIMIGYLGYLVTGGFPIALIFQLAHLVENVEFPEPDQSGLINKNWGEHEMRTTSNFGKSDLLNYLVGGLNFQVEHHLMPYISHVHYNKISGIVKETAKEFGLPYNQHPSMWKAIVSHYQTLRKLGIR